MPKGFRKKCQVALLSRKDFLAVERDVGSLGDDEQIVGNVLRQIPSMSRGPKVGGCGTGN